MSVDRARRPQRWGWHRLDPAVARRVVAGAQIGPGELVVDLGAGTGALTRALVDAGAHVVAVERHPGRVERLRRDFVSPPVTVVAADLRALRLPSRPFRVVANPPWSLAEHVRTALLRSPLLLRADLVLPRWLVHRWAHEHPGISVGVSIRAESFTPRAPAGAAVAIIEASECFVRGVPSRNTRTRENTRMTGRRRG